MTRLVPGNVIGVLPDLVETSENLPYTAVIACASCTTRSSWHFVATSIAVPLDIAGVASTGFSSIPRSASSAVNLVSLLSIASSDKPGVDTTADGAHANATEPPSPSTPATNVTITHVRIVPCLLFLLTPYLLGSHAHDVPLSTSLHPYN